MLEEARRRGFLGPGPVSAHLDHADGFGEALLSAASDDAGAGGASRRGADLGSGAGVPGLPLALSMPTTEWVLVEVGARRAAFLRDTVRNLGLEGRVVVLQERAELVGRLPAYRSTFDLVVARGFGRPSIVAECAAPLLRVGGSVIVSEPPEGEPARWPVDGLAEFGLVRGPAVTAEHAAFQVLTQREPCSDRFPRRVGVPAKRPLF
ncbi:MAG: RsmG family class I SAM-dependent methyltransferase [Acidimicrobiales bacterium]